MCFLLLKRGTPALTMESILEINDLPQGEKEEIYKRLIPPELFEQYGIDLQTCTGPHRLRLVRFGR